MGWLHIAGNAMADEAAAMGQDKVKPSEDLCEQTRVDETMVYNVVMRLAVIQAEIWRHRQAERFEAPVEAARV